MFNFRGFGERVWYIFLKFGLSDTYISLNCFLFIYIHKKKMVHVHINV